jgi:hypothetical protein
MKKTTLQDHFSIIVDERRETKNKLHKLLDILVITVCGVIAGANDWVSVEMFGNAQKVWLSEFLELPNGIPSHDTFTRVFRFIDPEQFRKCFVDWMESVVELNKGEVVAIDRKTIRRSYDRSKGKEAIHIISAFATENGVVCGHTQLHLKIFILQI